MKTEIIEVHPEFPDLEKIAQCSKVIRKGGLVIFPTETVYGVGADNSNPKAIRRLKEIKKRSEDKPFSVLIGNKDLVSAYTSSNKTSLYRLICFFWPGPLTVVVPDKNSESTIGIRMPDNEIALKILQQSQRAIAAPSANFEGNQPPTTCQEALRDLDGLVDIAVDGGKTKIGKGSTVVDLTKSEPVVLREGLITKEEIKKIMNMKTVVFVCTGNSCRSVMAEYLLKSRLSDRDDVEILSAGTGVFIHSTASSETITVLREEGIDATRHLSQPVSKILLKKADLVFVMTRGHRQQVLDRVPEVENRIYLLKEFVNDPMGSQLNMDVPDPIGRSYLEYKDCLGVIKQAINKIVKLI